VAKALAAANINAMRAIMLAANRSCRVQPGVLRNARNSPVGCDLAHCPASASTAPMALPRRAPRVRPSVRAPDPSARDAGDRRGCREAPPRVQQPKFA